jgi:hypothetical protein
MAVHGGTDCVAGADPPRWPTGAGATLGEWAAFCTLHKKPEGEVKAALRGWFHAQTVGTKFAEAKGQADRVCSETLVEHSAFAQQYKQGTSSGGRVAHILTER